MKIALIALTTFALGSGAPAQEEFRSRLLPITGPIRRAGVFHVATGTWTRDASLASVIGPDTIYNNSCSPRYFFAQIQGEKYQHRSRVPSPSGPSSDSQFYPGDNSTHQYDQRPGCQTSYTINGFEVAYCSSKPSGAGTITYVHQFAHSYTACGLSDMVPHATITLTGLPGGTATGAQLCWIAGVDLDATGASFGLMADGNGTYESGSLDADNTFGWSFGPTSAVTASDMTGPIRAGNYTWTGGVLGPLTPCTGTDGTIWDAPINQQEPGTGMGTQNYFRITGTNTAPSGSGCYFFAGGPQIDFYLKLFSDTGCPPPSELESFCFPRQAGVITCPCNNPPTAVGRGCGNFGSGPPESCHLGAAGAASVSNDSVVFTSSGENNVSFTVFLQSPSSVSTGLDFGAGVRCLGSNLKRLYTGGASAGSISRPGSGDPSVTVRSAALGDPISPGFTRFYMTYYRDPQAALPCSHPAKTFNCSQSGSLIWQP